MGTSVRTLSLTLVLLCVHLRRWQLDAIGKNVMKVHFFVMEVFYVIVLLEVDSVFAGRTMLLFPG